LFEVAKSGEVKAIREFLDRTEGRITEKREHSFDRATLDAIFAAMAPESADRSKAILVGMAKKIVSEVYENLLKSTIDYPEKSQSRLCRGMP